VKGPAGWSTERLILRDLLPADADGPYLDWVRDEAVTRFLEIRFAPPDRAGLIAYIEKMTASPVDLVSAILRKDTGTHIGNIRLGPIDRHHRRGVIGLMIGDRSAWGHGFASEAIAAISDHAFAEHGVEKLTAAMYAPNIGSRRAFEKAGFALDAVRSRHVILDGQRIDVVELARFAP